MSISAKTLANDLVLAAIRLTRLLRALDRHAQLTGPQASALAVIVFSRRVKVSVLADIEQVRRPTMSQLVSELETLGLIQRSGDPTDRRVSWVSATKRGQQLLQQGQERRIAPLAARIDTLGRDDKRALEQAVRLIDALSRPKDEG